MPSFRVSRNVPHSADDMFALVADVESYPQFLPLCAGMRVRRRVPLPDGRETILADMDVGYKRIRESFASRVTLDRDKRRILVEYVDGPFRHLENTWSFVDAPAPSGAAACVVEFFIDYEFRSRTLGLLMGTMFDAAFRKFAEAFERRADVVYGGKRAAAP